MMTPTENRHTMTSPASTIELRRARAQAGGGFARRMRALAGVALVCALALGAEGDVASDNNTLANGASARAQEVAREDARAGFLYSRWIEGRSISLPPGRSISLPPGKGSRVGNYELTPLPQHLPGGKGESNGFWSDVAGKVREGTTQRLRGSLLGVLPKPEELRAILVKYGNGEEFDMAQWREIRKQQLKAAIENAPLAFYADTEQSLASAISQTAVDRLGFVRRARVDFRTSLGDRQASGGVDAAGALRESADEVIGWQLRAYAGESGKRGGNIGAFWRRAQWLHFVDEGLLGANIFADYEDTDNGGFWRWSIGGEMKTRVGDVNVNRYFVITDPVVLANNRRVYSRAGLDIDAALNIPGAEWAKARVGYFLWEGEFGDADIEGFKAGFDFKPGAGVVVGIEFDGESGDIGGNFSYTHNIGEPFASAQSAGTFDPRAHFFDAVRREYSQRIVNTGAGDGANFAVIVTTGLDFTIRGELPGASAAATVSTLNITAANFTTGVNDEFAITGNVTVETDTAAASGMAVFRQRGGNWHLTLNANTEVAFTNTAHFLVINRGSGEFERVNPPRPAGVVVAGATLSLIGTRFRFGVPPQVSPQNKASITLVEGGMMVGTAAMNSITIKVGERASVMVMMGGSMVVVGCGEGQVANAGGAGARCSSGGSVDLTPVDAPPNVSVEGGRVLVPFGATVTVGHFDVAMLAAETTLAASVETAGFGIAAVTSADGMTVTYDVVLQESQATIAGTKNPRVIVSDIAEFVRPITVVFTVQVARKLQVNVNPAQVEVTQNIVRSGIASVNAAQGTPPYSYTLIEPQNLFNLGDGNNIVNNHARIQSTGVQNVVLEATDALQDKATVTLTVNVPPTPPLTIVRPGAGETAVVATNSVAVEAVQFVGQGGVPPLQYRIVNGANTVTVLSIPSSAGGGNITLDDGGRLLIQGDTANNNFPLTIRVVDAINNAVSRTIQVSLSEGLVLSGPVVNGVFTVTTHGGGSQSGVSRVLGEIAGQSQANINGWQFLFNGNSYVRFEGGGNTSPRRTIAYNGSHNAAEFLTISVEVSDDSGGDPTPDKATASFVLEVVNPSGVEAALSGNINLRYFTGENTAILTVTASGGAGDYQYDLSVVGGGNNNGANVIRQRADSSDNQSPYVGVLTYNANDTDTVTVAVWADDSHNLIDPIPAATVTLSALARLRAETITRPNITTGGTLTGQDRFVVTVSVSGGENRAQFAYTRVGADTQLANADINNSGVIFAADNTKIDANEVNNSKAGPRNFVYDVVDGAIAARRQTLRVTLQIQSVVPSDVAAVGSDIGNVAITVSEPAAAKLLINPSDGYTVTNYAFAQIDAGSDIVMDSFARVDGSDNVSVLFAASAAGTVTVSIAVSDQHEDTAPATVTRMLIAIHSITLGYAAGFDLSPQTINAPITFASVTIGGGLNARGLRLAGQSGANSGDLYMNDNGELIVRNNENRNETERAEAIVFTVVATADFGAAATLVGSVEVVADLRLNGGGEVVVTTGSRDITVATIRAIGGESPYTYPTPPTIPTGYDALGVDAASNSRYVILGNTPVAASRPDDTIIFDVRDSATDPGPATESTTLTINYVAPVAAANTYKDGGGVVTTAAGSQIIGTIAGSGGVGNFTYTEVGSSPLNVGSDGEINGTFNSPLTATMSVRVDDARSGGEDVGATHPVTVEVAVTAFAPVTANVNQTITRYRKGVSVTLATLRSYSGGSGAAGLTASVLSFYQANSRATVIDNEVVVWPDPNVTQRGTARIMIVTYDSANDAAPQSTITFPLYVVDALRWTSPPSEPLTVTTQDAQSGNAFTTQDALPRQVGVVGGNADNSYNLGSRTDGFALGTQNQQFSYTGNSGRFAQDADTVLVTVYGMDRNAADNYRQATSLTITVAFIDPQEDVTIGFAPGFDTSPLTAAGDITIGEVVVGGGLNAKDVTILGNGGNFRIEDSDSADTGRAFLILGGTNTTDRAATVTLSGNDDHTRTDAALVTVEVNVVDRVKLRGAGARYTVLAQAGNAVTTIFSFEPIGGMPDADDGYSVQSVVAPTNVPAGFTRTGTRTVAIGRNAVSIATGEHIFIQEVADTANTVQGTATVLVINELALTVGDNLDESNPFNGAIVAGESIPFGKGFASGGAGAYTYNVEGPGDNINVQNNGVMVASHHSTHAAATITYTLIANDAADATAPATVEFTLTVLPPVSAAPLPVILVTTKSTPGGAGAAGPPRTVTTRVEFTYETSGLFAVDIDLRSSSSIVITVAPGADVTVNRAIGAELNTAQGNRFLEIIGSRSSGQPVGNNFQIPLGALNLTLTPYPALTGGGGGGGTVPAFTIDASGGQPMLSYYLNNAQTPGALADILYYTADSADSGVIYFNAGVRARASAGNVTVAHNLQVRDSSSPTRNANVTGMLTIRYVLPPPVTVAVNQTVNAYKTGVSVTIAELTYTGGASDNLAATVLGVGGGTDDITVQVSGGDVLVSADAAGTGIITATINAYDAGNDTAENDTTILTVEFVPPLVINNIPEAVLEITTRGAQPNAVAAGIALPREMTASGGNGTYTYNVRTGLFGAGNFGSGFSYANGILRQSGNTFQSSEISVRAIAVVTDNEIKGYQQSVTAIITVNYIHPPALSMGFVESPVAAALTTANNITIGTIALTGGLTDLSIVIAGHADFELSFIESSPATAALILSGSNNANTVARTVAVTITGNDNHLETTAQLLSITVRINDALTLISAPPVITITAGEIDGFTGEANMTAILANLNVQGNLSDDITVSIIDAADNNLTMSLRNLLSLTGATANWTLDITSGSVAQTHIGTPYNLAFEIRDAAMSVATVTIPVSVVNAPVRADTAVSNITTYFYTGFTSEVTLTAITFTNLYIPATENASITITVAPTDGNTETNKYTPALSAAINAGAVEIKYTRPTTTAPKTDDDFTLNATVIISNAADNSKNPFTATATLQWRIGGIPALSIDFQSPPNTVFIRGYKGTIGVLTVTAN